MASHLRTYQIRCHTMCIESAAKHTIQLEQITKLTIWKSLLTVNTFLIYS